MQVFFSGKSQRPGADLHAAAPVSLLDDFRATHDTHQDLPVAVLITPAIEESQSGAIRFLVLFCIRPAGLSRAVNILNSNLARICLQVVFSHHFPSDSGNTSGKR